MLLMVAMEGLETDKEEMELVVRMGKMGREWVTVVVVDLDLEGIRGVDLGAGGWLESVPRRTLSAHLSSEERVQVPMSCQIMGP